MSNTLSTYVAFPLGILGNVLILGTIWFSWWKGPHTHDMERVLAGVLLIFIADITWLVSDLIGHHWVAALSDVGWTVVLILIWFGRPPKWKKKAKLIGAKAKALRDKIVRKLKDARPRVRLRVPVPVPG
jgi:hypothetical protein